MRLIVTMMAVLLGAGCGTARTEVLATQVTELQKQLTQLRRVQAGMSITVEDLETRMFLVQDAVDTTRKNRTVGRYGPGDLPIERVRPQPGPESVYDPSADKPLAQADPGVVEFDQLSEDGRLLQKGEPVPQPGSPRNTQAPAVTVSKKTRLPKSEVAAVQLYKESYALVGQKQYQEAIDGFNRFIEQYPTHGYADNALYWMGECYYDRGLWMKAMETFQKVIQNYPLGNKAPDAMLKLGLCHQQLRNFRQAREVLEQVVDIYPNNTVARIARTRLEQLP